MLTVNCVVISGCCVFPGCLHDSGCIDVGAGYGERCNTHTCEKKRDGNSITYYFVTRRGEYGKIGIVDMVTHHKC